jgi:hypothetical protein
MKDLKEIAEVNNLQYITTSNQANGYPSDLRGALIGFDSFTQAEELAAKFDLEIASFYKKDGWNLWYRDGGRLYEAFKNSSEDYGDNYNEFHKGTEENFIEHELKPFFDNEELTFDSIEAILKTKKEIWEEIDKMDDDEIVITNEGRYYETIKKESMYFYHDTKHYVIGLQNKD